MRVLVLGSKGFLGSHFLKCNVENRKQLISFEITGSDFRFTPDTPESNYNFSDFDYVVNCIAIANIELCEAQPDLAKWVNEDFPGKLALYAKKTGCKLVHFSTDAIFDGSIPMVSEEATPNPISIYGVTKMNGERNVLFHSPESLVLRTNFLGRSPKGNSLFDFIVGKLKNTEGVPGFMDVYFTPIYIEELVRITLEMMQNHEQGIYHLVGNDRISKFDLARKVESSIGVTDNLVFPVSIALDSKFNNRSRDLSLSNEKMRLRGYTPKAIDIGISQLINDIR